MRETATARPSRRCRRSATLAIALSVVSIVMTADASATEQIYFSAVDDVTAVLVQHINAETVRLDISSWYLSEHAVSIAIANRWAAGVPVRLIGDRAAIFEADPHTKAEFYWLANQGVPIRLRFNPTWFPEIDHWKMALFVGQGLVEFGSGNFTPVELAPVSATNYDDETELFTDDPVLVNAFKTKFDLLWNDTTTEPESILSGPPYLKDWNDACAHEPTGNCADYATLYPTPAPMIINTARLEGDHPMPPDLIWGQGADFNTRLVQAITSESSRIDLVVYRLEVDDITNALLSRFQAGVPVRILVDPHQYTNSLWPEYWLTHANLDKLWAAGVPIRQARHAGVTHMKTLVTSTVATNASSNFGPNWQRDHDYLVSAATKPAIYQAIANRVDAMWNDPAGFGPLQLTPPNAAALASPAAGAVGVAPTTSLVWNTAAWAVSYDVYLGASPSSLALVANVPAQLVTNPPATYAWTPPAPLQAGATYYWQVVSRTNATPLAPTMIATSSTGSFTTSASGGGGLPSPWQHQDVGATGLTGGASYAAGTFTVRGAGADIWGTSDAFQYVDQPLNGDGQIVARVTGISGANTFAKAGVMLRESTAAGAVHVILDLRPGGSLEFMSRATTGGATSYLAGATQGTPAWLKLTRSGATVTGAVSADGVTWTLVGTTTVSMATGALIGLAVTSHDPTQLNTATFDTVTVGGAATPPPGTPAAPNPASGASGVGTTPTLAWTATGATSYDVRFGATNPPPLVSTGQSAATYLPGLLSSGTTYFWQITAHNVSGAATGPVWSFATTAAAPPPPGAPASPSPASGASGVGTTPTLVWTSTGATSYDVRFGVSNPPPLVSSGQSAATYSTGSTGPLSNSTTYFWQVTARNASGTVTGPVWSFTTSAPPSSNIVIYASDIPSASLHGTWTVAADPTSPNGVKLVTPDQGWATTSAPLAAPADYVDVTFDANAGTPYTIWLRLQALNNSKYNDSVWVQFSDAMAAGASIYPMNTTSGLDVNLATDATAVSDNRWGWQNTAYWLSQPTTVTFAVSGTHTLRIQVREDGVEFDQIVLSSSQYLTAAPGGYTNDTTIVPKP